MIFSKVGVDVKWLKKNYGYFLLYLLLGLIGKMITSYVKDSAGKAATMTIVVIIVVGIVLGLRNYHKTGKKNLIQSLGTGGIQAFLILVTIAIIINIAAYFLT